MRIFHLSWPRRKHEENSLRGIRAARRWLRRLRVAFGWIDLDELITKADPDCPLAGDDEHVDGVCRGHQVGTHWDRPMERDGFHDPKGLIDPHTRVRDMTLAEVQRLRTADGYRIRRIHILIRACAIAKVGAYLEPKDDPRFEQDWTWQYIARVRRRTGARIRVRSIKNFGGFKAGYRRVLAARRNGFKARTIR